MKGRDLFSLEGRRVLVTGASSGIGRACALMLSDCGACVVLTGRRVSALNETLRMMTEPSRHQVWTCDVCNAEEVSALVRAAGKLDGLVHAAGIAPMCPVGFIDAEHVSSVMETNYLSFLELMKHYSKVKNRGPHLSVVAISSVSSEVGWAGGAVYCGSKGALSATVRALALELASKGIRVNAVCPSNVKTPLYEAGAVDLNDEEAMKVLLAKQPLGLGLPEQIASSVVFLLSDASSFITGVNLPVDGGYLAQ